MRKVHNHMLNSEPGSASELEIGPTGLLINAVVRDCVARHFHVSQEEIYHRGLTSTTLFYSRTDAVHCFIIDAVNEVLANEREAPTDARSVQVDLGLCQVSEARTNAADNPRD